MLISHYIAQDILEDWDEQQKLIDNFKKFSKRYPDDSEFQALNKEFEEYLKTKDANTLEEIKKKIGELKNARKLESGGGSGLPFSDRRHTGEKQSGR